MFQREKRQAEEHVRELAVAAEEAKKARGEAERILDYLVFDLRDKLAPVGRLDLVEDVHKQVEAYYARMGVDEKDPEVLRRRSVTYDNQSDRLLAQGNLEGALQAYQVGLKITEALAQRDPSNTEWQRDLSVSHNKIGNVRAAQGDLAGALQAYQADLMIAEALAQRDPSNTQWQRDLSYSYTVLGDIYLERRDLDNALKYHRLSLAIDSRLAAQHPSNLTWQLDKAILSLKVASLLDTSKKAGKEEARNLYEQSLTILRRLDAEGRLPPNRKEWIENIQTKLKELGNQP